MKKARTILAIMLALVMVLSVLPASFADSAKNFDKQEERKASSSEQKLERKTGRTLVSQQEPLKIDNKNSIDPETVVTAIVVFEDAALSDTYTADEIRAKKAESAQNRLSSAHDTFFKSLSFEAKRLYDYTALINGMSIQTAYKNLSVMEKMSGVKKVYVANEYDAPVTQTPSQANANVITGAYAMQNVGLFGDGMVVAVLDTGLNLTHEAFQDYGVITDPAFTEDYVESVNTTVPGKYVSAKIPFAYDYYAGDDDVTDYNGHGSHVSGTITGLAIEDDGAIKFMGAAPCAQLVFMKIFADQSSGTNSGIYMAALEDCFLLGVDAINMSIGAPGGFVYDPELEDEFGNVYKKLDQAGIITCVAAGNEYSMAYNAGNFAGDGYVLAEYADYATVASPSTYEGNISVASMENYAYPSMAIEYNGQAFAYTDNCDDGVHGWLDNFANQTLELVYCGQGTPDEVPDEVEGKVALVVRGNITFSEKNENVAAKGATGMILFNNQSGTIGMLIDPYMVPAISITQDAGLTILAGLDVDNTVNVPTEMMEVENPSAWLMSDFSNWGTTPSLELKPQISAPGGMIYSSVAGASDAYEVYSGTSMATPNTTGSYLLLVQYLKETYPALSRAQRAELAEDLMESTANLPIDGDGYLYSPRKCGSGILNLENAVTCPIYFVEPIVNLYDDPEKTGVFTMRYTVVNLSDEEQVYDLEVIGLYDYVTQGYNTLTSDYLFDGYGMTVDGDTHITIPANGTYEGKLKLTLDDSAKSYFDGTFANGNFIEGYVYFVNENPEAGYETPVGVGLLGDANLDGKITAADAAEILRAVVGLIELSPTAAFFADVNLDGEVTAADAAFLLRAVVGLENLSPYSATGSLPNTDAHFTFCGFYGDWTQGPVLDKIWSNAPDYLMYLAAEYCYYPEYAAAGYLPTDLFTPMETNITISWVYGVDSGMNYLYNYLGQNPATVLLSNEDIVAEAWNEYFETDGFMNPLHNAITNSENDGDEYFVETFYSMPIQLRNARHLIMTVSDAETGEIYYVDDTEYLGKAYFDKDTSTWGARGSFSWDGVVTNEESDLYGEFVPNGTICLVTYETMVDYPGAELNTEYQFQLLVDSESAVVTGIDYDEEAKTVTVNLADNGSGLSFADAWYYDNALDGYDLGYAVGDNAAEFVLDVSEIPEDVSYIQVEVLDYATNLKTYTINFKNGTLADGNFGEVDFAVNQILNDKASLGTIVPVEGIITAIYNDTVYLSAVDPIVGDPLGIAVNLADKTLLDEINVGDAYVFAGELDNYYGCPRLDNAEITYVLYINDLIDENDSGDIIYNYVFYPLVLYPMYGLGDMVEFDDIFENPAMCVGTMVYLEDLEVIDVAEVGDGTRTISVTNGTNCVDIVGCAAGENVYVGDALYYGFFIPVYDKGTLQLYPILGGMDWYFEIIFYSDLT